MKTIYPYLISLVLACMGMDAIAKDAVTASVEKAVEAGFSELERQLLGNYLEKLGIEENNDEVEKDKKKKDKKSKKGLPPGLAKKDNLPPGLANQLQKNGTLPPGLAKRGLPAELEHQLPPIPADYERQVIENAAIVLVHKATGKIVDVITEVMNN